jgi:putative tricarboxylic transport membrane protein
MKLADTIAGLLAAMLGLAVVLHARTFPPMPGQPVGPSWFPTLIGAGLIVAGAVMTVVDVRLRKGGTSRALELEPWTARPRLVGNFFLVVAALLFYALAVDLLGFLLTATLVLSVLFLAFGVRRVRILPLALAVTLVIHFCFYTLLRVPLPWGVLERIAW